MADISSDSFQKIFLHLLFPGEFRMTPHTGKAEYGDSAALHQGETMSFIKYKWYMSGTRWIKESKSWFFFCW
jgi:hypothetical protein